MARPRRSLPSFAVSLLLSGAFHGALLALLAGGAFRGQLGSSLLYEVDIEPEPPRVPPAPIREEVAPPTTMTEHTGSADDVPGGSPGGAPVPFRMGPGARVGEQSAPAAAQAGRVLAAEGEGQAADFTVLQGVSERYAGGVTTETGTSATAVRDPSARGAGVLPPHAARAGTPAASAERATPRPPPSPRVSVIARPMSASWSCPFPPEADANNVNHARVLLAVTVSSDGFPSHVALLQDPGGGFGTAARSCAFRQKYVPSRDPDGRAVAGTTAPFHVTFVR